MTESRASSSAPFARVFLFVLIAAFVLRNLPWHLDDFDQAKQAFVSFEMVEDGQWWFQHTPSGRIATKPPLAGWISAACYFAMGGHGWEFAWRLPSFASALILLTLLWRSGRALAGPVGALLAACAFGFNLLAPRLATLVRTDMLLTLLIFLAGWFTFEKVRRAEPWIPREQRCLALAVLAALMVKGPILYAFLLPGLVAYAVLQRRRKLPNHAWPGWLPWFAPLLVFAAWAGIGIWMSREFYEQVVLREFLGRFDLSDAPVHQHQPLWFYLVHMLHKWAPWSVALVALLFQRRLRARVRAEPALLWLACWALGGLLFMSLVPSKRVDRIFPILPPLCLLFAALASEWFSARRRHLLALLSFGAVISTGYALARMAAAFHDDTRALVRFGAQVREATRDRPARLAVTGSGDEGLVLYTGRTRFDSMGDARRRWTRGEIDRVVLREAELRERADDWLPFRRLLQLPQPGEKRGAYLLLERPVAEARPPEPR